VLLLRDAHPPRAAADGLIALYVREARPGRRRALIDETMARASQVGASEVVEELAQRYILDVRRGTSERRSAERLYRRVMTARAIRHSAHADLDAVVEQTDSYEALAGSIELRLRAGESAASIGARYAKPGVPLPRNRFARAYVLAMELPALEGEAASRATAEALALLRASWAALGGKRMVHMLQGALLHDRYLRTGERAWAEQANMHYVIALERMSQGSRFRATVLGQLGILQTQVGNYRIAVGYLDERDKLPYADAASTLAVHLAHARALLHAEREADAATTADRAVALAAREPALAQYRLLALDRAAVCNLAAGRFPRALALYDQLIPGLAPSSTRNRFVARLARAACAVGAGEPERGLADLREVERALRDPSVIDQLNGARGTNGHLVRMYGLIATGLRARAYRAEGRFDEEARALGEQRTALQERFVTTHRDEDQRSAMLTEMQLALNASDRHDPAAAASWLTQALARADDLRARAHGQLDNAQLDVLWLAAQLTLEMKTPLVRDLVERLQRASGVLAVSKDPALRSYERWFEMYLPVVSPTPSLSPQNQEAPARFR
jgi:tetratricopeptide (TPR) repeat protein